MKILNCLVLVKLGKLRRLEHLSVPIFNYRKWNLFFIKNIFPILSMIDPLGPSSFWTRDITLRGPPSLALTDMAPPPTLLQHLSSANHYLPYLFGSALGSTLSNSDVSF